jgi:hypothetical protein
MVSSIDGFIYSGAAAALLIAVTKNFDEAPRAGAEYALEETPHKVKIMEPHDGVPSGLPGGSEFQRGK